MVDFACAPLTLVIEIDGGVHGLDEVVLRGPLRKTEIESLGCAVIRFTNAEVGSEWRTDQAIIPHKKPPGARM